MLNIPRMKKFLLVLVLVLVLALLPACTSVPVSSTEKDIPFEPTPSQESIEMPANQSKELSPSPEPETAPTVDTGASAPPSSIIWKATHETGDISEWQQHGDFIRQGQSAYYSMVTPHAHSGKYSVALTIDTEGESSSGDFAAYLFYWDQLPGDAYYYSAWYYIPEGTRPQYWWNIWQWKSTYNGNSDYSVPMYILDILEQPNRELALHLVYRPDINEKIDYRQIKKTVPVNQWFHIEAFYKKGTANNGQVIIWQDGEELFNLTDVQTTMQDNTVYWSVNHYTDYILPNPSSIYIDDAAISTERIGPVDSLP